MLKRIRVFSLLSILTIIFILVQAYLFYRHYKVSSLVDSLAGASIALELLHPIILLPIATFIVLQITAYVLFVTYIWFITISFAEYCRLTNGVTKILAIILWSLTVFFLLAYNHYYFPDSIFSRSLSQITLLREYGKFLLIVSASLLTSMTLLSWLHCFLRKRHRVCGGILLAIPLLIISHSLFEMKIAPHFSAQTQPNIILIGLDSVRPDFTGFYGNQMVHTPNVDKFLQQSVAFSESYTPFARTFPAWMSILTGKYPLHHGARNNLIDTVDIVKQETLAKKMQQAGYATVYATDENRFSNITKDYGFDRVIGAKMGANDFILAGLSDFPLANFLVSLPIARILFPYHYANRAASITYQPDKFLHRLQLGLADLPDNKPFFLNIHLCISHWPHKWADKGQAESRYLLTQYIRSVNAVDKQFAEVMQLLQSGGFLDNAWVIVLSDHGTALGLKGDRIIAEDNYRGDKNKMKLVQKLKLALLPQQNQSAGYTVHTAYGQGTNILSLAQNHTLLAFQHFPQPLTARRVKSFVSLIDIAPTIFDILALAPMQNMDGISLREYFSAQRKEKKQRIFFMETGDSLSAIETDKIYIEKVIRHQIGIYEINPATGLLSMNPLASQSIIRNKQLAIWSGEWILAYYPATKRDKKIIPAYYILANVKTGKWLVENESGLNRNKIANKLLKQWHEFYMG